MTKRARGSLLVLFILTLAMASNENNQAVAAGGSTLVYFGTYTGEKSRGIYVSHWDSKTGQLSPPQLAAETTNPSFLAIHPNRRFLYAVGELSAYQGQRTGALSAFRIEGEQGTLALLNQQPSGGSGPCHVSLDRQGRCVLAANYGGGSICALPVLETGELGEPGSVIQHKGSSVNPKRQAGPHAHQILMDSRNRRALVCDLGLDQVLVYQLDSRRAALSANDPPCARVSAGLGPRHLAFHPNGRTVYVINELGSSVTAFKYDHKSGALSELQTVSSLPPGYEGQNSGAEIEVHPSGKFVYASNRGHDSIAVFGFSRDGHLDFAGTDSTRGKTPRHFAVDPSGQWLLAANQASDSVVVFRINSKTGRLTPVGQGVEVGSPVCVLFVPGR